MNGLLFTISLMFSLIYCQCRTDINIGQDLYQGKHFLCDKPGYGCVNIGCEKCEKLEGFVNYYHCKTNDIGNTCLTFLRNNGYQCEEPVISSGDEE